jgi:hypothetical protein
VIFPDFVVSASGDFGERCRFGLGHGGNPDFHAEFQSFRGRVLGVGGEGVRW